MLNIDDSDATSTTTSPRRHERFYLQDGNVIFQVEDVLFNVHRYFFQQYSSSFEGMFLCKPADGEALEGSVDGIPVTLEQTSALDFERLLCVMYPRGFEQSELTTTAEWTSVLRLAHRWQFDSILKLVTKQLPQIASLVDQIALARQYNLPGIVGPAGKQLCDRAQPLTLSETRRLGTDAAHAIWSVRERGRTGWRNVAADVGSQRVLQAFPECEKT